MQYRAAYQHPNFSQSGPDGDGWERIGNKSELDGLTYSGAVIFRHRDSGAEWAAPLVWYTATPASYANTLRFSLEQCELNALRHEADDKPWSAHEAAERRRGMRRIRAMILLCERQADALTAGRIDFRGLNNPTLSREAEDRIIAEIEAGL